MIMAVNIFNKEGRAQMRENLKNKFRLVIMNDDSYEEVVTFRLSRLSVYIAFSSIFVILVGLTTALIIFTPLKYYIHWSGTD